MSQQVEQQKEDWFHQFASLKWYDGAIEFAFRFAAKTSEPLLAIGIVYSAADILSKGHLGYNNPTVSNLWAITQALAIESSGGVVLVYGLQSLKEKDTLKATLYLILSALLAIAGGVMLFMQLAGWENSQGDTPFMLGLFALRCVVSVGYIYLCRTKHIRFTDLASEQTEPNTVHDDAIKQLTEQVSILAANMGQITATVTEVKTTVTQITAAALPALPERTEHPVNTVESDLLVNREPVHKSRVNTHEVNTLNKKDRVHAFLSEHPGASVSDIMNTCEVSRGYASEQRALFTATGGE